MKQLVTLIVCFAYLNMHGQNKNINWTFGDSAGVNFSNLIAPTTFKSAVKSRGSCASISDTSNNLIIYYAYDPKGFNGSGSPYFNGNVYDNSNVIMQNGDLIVSNGWYYEGVIIPFPQNSSKYYLFTIGVTPSVGLYYSVIDMNLNNGLGAVTQKNIQVNNMKANDGLTAVQQGNGRDWWLIFRNWGGVANNTFYKYLIDNNGINLPDTQQIGTIINSDGNVLNLIRKVIL